MAYIFHEDELPRLVSAVPGRERTFFVNKELTKIDDMLAGSDALRERSGRASALPRELRALLFVYRRTTEPSSPKKEFVTIGPGDLVFIPAEEKHRLRATKSPLFYFEFQAPNRFVTTILEGTQDDLRWNRVEGRRVGPDVKNSIRARRSYADIH